MGFLEAPERPQVSVVATSLGSARHRGTTYQKARAWVLEDRMVILCVPDGNRGAGVNRILLGTATRSEWKARSKQLLVYFEDESVLDVNAKGCGCGAGAVGNAGPIAEPHNIARVRPPEWHLVVSNG